MRSPPPARRAAGADRKHISLPTTPRETRLFPYHCASSRAFRRGPSDLPPIHERTKRASQGGDCAAASQSRKVTLTYSRPTVVHP
ncbi:hypothetical protein GCM10010381_59030 [Streptomyces xantholiticus]|nr:hypothetical protein GCM10010381_59030 [Streptomyces xantholiticus]